MLFLLLGLFYKTMGLLDEVNNSYNNNNSYNLSTINTGCGLVAGGRGTKNVGIQKKAHLVWWTYNFSSYPIISNTLRDC